MSSGWRESVRSAMRVLGFFMYSSFTVLLGMVCSELAFVLIVFRREARWSLFASSEHNRCRYESRRLKEWKFDWRRSYVAGSSLRIDR